MLYEVITQRDIQPFSKVCSPKNVLGLAGQPGTGHDLVVETDHNRPFACNFSKAVNDIGGALNVVRRVEKHMKRGPGARVHDVFQPLPYGHLTALVDLFFGKPGVFNFVHGGQNLLFGFKHLLIVILGTFDVV